MALLISEEIAVLPYRSLPLVSGLFYILYSGNDNKKTNHNIN